MRPSAWPRKGDVVLVRVRTKRGEEERRLQLLSVTLRPRGFYVGYRPVLADGSWDCRGGLWGYETLPDGFGPFQWGVIHWHIVKR